MDDVSDGFDDDRDFGSEADAADADSDSLPTMACPSCRGEVTEDTQKCPHCGDWITPVDGASGRTRRYVFVLAVFLMLLAMLAWMI